MLASLSHHLARPATLQAGDQRSLTVQLLRLQHSSPSTSETQIIGDLTVCRAYEKAALSGIAGLPDKLALQQLQSQGQSKLLR